MKRFPVCIQLDLMDCGPSCLKIIATFYGKEFPLETLREYVSITKDGSSLMGISKAAEKIGFKTIGGRLTLEKLNKQVPLPCILHWNQDHFVVLYKIKNKRNNRTYYISDPGKGLVHYSEKEFKEAWISTKTDNEERGIALLLDPTEVFYQQQNINKKHNKISFLSGYFKRYKKLFEQLIIGLLAGSILQLIFPFLTQAIVDIGIGNKDINFIWLILSGQLMLLLGTISIDFIRRRILLHISTRINISLISDFFIKLMKLPMKFFDTKHLGDLLERIEDHSRIERFLTTQTLNLIFSFFSMIIFSIVLLIYSLKIFLIFILGSILYGIWLLCFVRKRRILDYKFFEKQAVTKNKVYQMINGMQEIKLQGCEQRKRWEWEDTQADLFEINLESLSLQQNQEAGSIFINQVKNILITILAATSVIKGEITLGMMLSIQYIIGQLNSPIEQIMGFIFQWQDVSISLERMNEVHNMQDEGEEKREIAYYSENSNKDIVIKNLQFSYDSSRPIKILNNINLIIPEGKITAIVGSSGSGKTTLIKLLLGYYTPTDGEIYIGNHNLNDLNLDWWRAQCGAVMQEGYIFSESIAKNIAVSNDIIETDKLINASKLANMDSFISSLPLSYNTIIGQEGQGLSQGQKQRLLIARAIYKNPQFIFFDEATNALDANNEKEILDNLEKFYEGKTVIVVAHRLSTVKNADQIIVLENGEIAEMGNHQTLTRLKGKYYQLVKNQLELGN